MIAYHFCRHDVKDTLRPLAFLRNLVFMLRQELPEYRDALSALPMQNALVELSKDSADKLVGLFESLVVAPLSAIAPRPEREANPCLILVDALDEAVNYTGTSLSIVSLIETRLERLPRWIRWVVTSRPDSAAAAQLGRGCDEHVVDILPLDERAHPEDFDEFITTSFEKDGKSLPDDRIRKLILSKSGNNFQYIALLVRRILNDDWTEDDIRRAPRGLYGFYRLEFERLYPDPKDGSYRRIAAPMLESIMAAREPLSSGFLGRVIGVKTAELQGELRRLAGYLPEYTVNDRSTTSRWQTG